VKLRPGEVRRLRYEKLAGRLFWLNHDPTVTRSQFCDAGKQYRPAIFYTRGAEAPRRGLEAKWDKDEGPSSQSDLTPIVPADDLWPAEAYHQGLLQDHPGTPYKFYVTGADATRDSTSSGANLRKKLSSKPGGAQGFS